MSPIILNPQQNSKNWILLENVVRTFEIGPLLSMRLGNRWILTILVLRNGSQMNLLELLEQ